MPVARARVRPTALDLDLQKRLHAFDAWAGRNRLGRNLFVWRFFLSTRQLRAWEPLAVRRLTPPGFPPALHSVWRRRDGWSEQVVGIDVLECASRLVAHEYLVRILAQFESPLVGREPDTDVGDVAFAAPGGAALAFARANLVFLVRSAGRIARPVTGLAAHIDADLVAPPAVPEAEVERVPEIRTLEAAPAPAAGLSRLRVDAAHPEERPFFYKFFSRSGEVLLHQGRLAYRQREAGRQRVAVYAVTGQLAAAREALEFDGD